jgi:hypothetical protein
MVKHDYASFEKIALELHEAYCILRRMENSKDMTRYFCEIGLSGIRARVNTTLIPYSWTTGNYTKQDFLDILQNKDIQKNYKNEIDYMWTRNIELLRSYNVSESIGFKPEFKGETYNSLDKFLSFSEGLRILKSRNIQHGKTKFKHRFLFSEQLNKFLDHNSEGLIFCVDDNDKSEFYFDVYLNCGDEIEVKKSDSIFSKIKSILKGGVRNEG